jgi:hypothetical protein
VGFAAATLSCPVKHASMANCCCFGTAEGLGLHCEARRELPGCIILPCPDCGPVISSLCMMKFTVI